MTLRIRILTAAVASIGAGAIGLLAYGLFLQAQAESLLKDVVALSVVNSTESDVDRVVRDHRRFLVSHETNDGMVNTTFKVQNSWLARLKLEPPAEFRVAVVVKDGRVHHISAGLFRYMDIYPTFGASAGFVDEYIEAPSYLSRGGHYAFPTPVGKPYLRVLLDSHATQDERQRAFAFRFNCLVKPGSGCDLPCDYLPLAWQDYKNYVNSTGLIFNQYYPKSGRCSR